MKKLILAALLILIAAISASAAPVQDDSGAYIIKDAEDLKWFRKSVNSGMTKLNAIMSANIDLGGRSWQPIGKSEETAYNGNFDGCGHSIRGLSIRGEGGFLGLFGCIDIAGSVSNVIVENAAIHSSGEGGSNIGGIAGTSKGIIDSCTVIKSDVQVRSAITKPEPIHAGAIVGFNYDGVITDCVAMQNEIKVFNKTISRREMTAGGICGMNIGLKQHVGTIIGCEARANEIIIAADSSTIGSYGGGIAGLTLSGMIVNCTVYGGKVVNQNGSSCLSALGGVLGSSMRGSYIENCKVDGDILIRSDKGAELSYLGGLAGNLFMSNVSTCIVRGVIMSANESAPHTIGGISGSFDGGKISDCRVASIIMPKNRDKANFQGAVAGMLLKTEGNDDDLMMVENTWFHKTVANGLAIGINYTRAKIDTKTFDTAQPPGMR